MFEVGFTEIVLIFGIALLVLGPQRLPKLAADVGRWAGRARAMARQLQHPARAGNAVRSARRPEAHPGLRFAHHSSAAAGTVRRSARGPGATRRGGAAESCRTEAPATPDKTATDEPKSV